MMNRKNTSTPTRRMIRMGALALASTMLMLVGCSKPPPVVKAPPPPPPPPPPARIKLEDVQQELHVDARVQVAPGLDVSDGEAEFAKAVLRLADAIAKGDDKATRTLLTPAAKSVLEDIKASGGWSEATKKIEAVRIVYVGGVPSEATLAAAAASAGDAAASSSAASDMMAKLMAALPADQKDKLQAMMAEIAKDPSKVGETIDKVIESAKASGAPDAVIQSMQQSKAAMESSLAAAAAAAPAAAAAVSTGQGFLIAVQDPTGSYLLGWQGADTGGSFVFSNTMANMGSRPRASGWDGIGTAGFSDVAVAAATDSPDSAKTKQQADDAPSSSPDAPSAPSEPGPRKKSTPAGPVTIPGG